MPIFIIDSLVLVLQLADVHAMLQYLNQGLTFPKRCPRCRIRKHLEMNPPGSIRVSAYDAGEKTRDRTRTSSSDSSGSSMMASMMPMSTSTPPMLSARLPVVPLALRRRSSDYISSPSSRTSSMEGSTEEQPYFSPQCRGPGATRSRYSHQQRMYSPSAYQHEGQRLMNDRQKMCSYWLHGSCRFGADCRNIHGTTSSLSLMSRRHEHEQEKALLGDGDDSQTRADGLVSSIVNRQCR